MPRPSGTWAIPRRATDSAARPPIFFPAKAISPVFRTVPEIALGGFVGLRKGLVASLLAITGIVAGAVIGARVATVVLSGGSHSPYAPLVALGGAVIGAAVLEALGSMAGSFFRAAMRFPPLRAL